MIVIKVLILAITGGVLVTSTHICIFKEKYDYAEERWRWGLPAKERCLCEAVLAPTFNSNCSKEDVREDLLFVDDPYPLIVKENWKQGILDKLLERIGYCPFMTEWSPWGECNFNGLCPVFQNRTRECNGTQNSGIPCLGDTIEFGDCNITNCPSWTAWSSWTDCEFKGFNNTCPVLRNRSRECVDIDQLGVPCRGVGEEEVNCEGEGYYCPFWLEWTSWTPCSLTCGVGSIHRARTCSIDGACEGSDSETDICTLYCAYWGYWTDWGTCSVACGGGQKYRYRTCHDFGPCSGADQGSYPCNTHACPPPPTPTPTPTPPPECFAADSLVRVQILADGEETFTSKQLSDLIVGDYVESYDPDTKSVIFSEVYFITHQHDNSSTQLLKLIFGYKDKTESSLRLHPKHLVYACINQSGLCNDPPLNPVVAESVKVGDMLWVRNDDGKFIAAPVIIISNVHTNVRHPMTFNHYIVVDGALASAHMYNEYLYRQATIPLRILYNINPRIIDMWVVKKLVALWDIVEDNLLR